MKIDAGKDSRDFRIGDCRNHAHGFATIEDCETIRKVASQHVTRIKDYEPMRIDTACLHSEFEDCESIRTISPYRFSNIAHLQSCTWFRHIYFGQGLICAASRIEDRIQLQVAQWPEGDDQARPEAEVKARHNKFADDLF